MKKVLIIAIMLIMTASLIVGCNTGSKDPDPTPTVKVTAEPTAVPTPSPTPTPPPPPEPGTNVALNKYYEVSSETDETYVQWGWSSEFINDGIIKDDPTSVGWTIAVNQFMTIDEWEEQWCMIDLGQVVSIDKVILYARGDSGVGFPEDFFIEVSTDNKSYTTIKSVEAYTGGQPVTEPCVLEFDAVDARYVRLVVTKPFPVSSGQDGFLLQLAEFEIYSAPSR